MFSEYRQCFKLVRRPTETPQQYHARARRCIEETRAHCNIKDLDAVVLGRMYDFIGHVIRMGQREGTFLPYIALCHRDKHWCLEHARIMGHQGHSGRISPWTHERQFYEYFASKDLNWKEVAADKDSWTKHKKSWSQHIYGRRYNDMKCI